MSAHEVLSANETTKVRPLPEQVCTPKPMILIQYHTIRRAADIFVINIFIAGKGTKFSPILKIHGFCSTFE